MWTEEELDFEITKEKVAEMQLHLIKQLYPDGFFDRISNFDYGFHVTVVAATPLPQHLVYLGMHQCYSTEAVAWSSKLTESECGQIDVKRLLEGGKGHYSPYEHASITFVIEGVNHGTLQQLLRSRIGVSPSVQSFRYTSNHILEAASGERDIEKVVYIRPPGTYHDRESGIYSYDPSTRAEDLSLCSFLVKHVAKRLKNGMPPEQARGQLPFDYRQNAIITYNARSLMGFFDRRSKRDAQNEIQILTKLLMEKFICWVPETAEYYMKNRAGKALLSP